MFYNLFCLVKLAGGGFVSVLSFDCLLSGVTFWALHDVLKAVGFCIEI